MSERVIELLRRGWPQCFAVAVGALVLAAIATMFGRSGIAQHAGAAAWLAALVGTGFGLAFHGRVDDEVDL